MTIINTTKSNVNASRHAAALALIGLIAGWSGLCYQRTTHATKPTWQAQSRINPNTAPWFELTELPRIGPTLARRIVQYRQLYRSRHTAQPAALVFTSAQGVAAVRGIGIKTVARIRPLLRF